MRSGHPMHLEYSFMKSISHSPKVCVKYILPLVNSRTHSRITFVSISECFSSIVAGGGAVDANMVPITSDGVSFAAFINLSRTSCSSSIDKGSGTKGNPGKAEGRKVRFDNLVQKDNLLATVLNTGELRTEASELGVEMSERFDRAEEGRWIGPVSSVPFEGKLPERDLTAGCERNFTRMEPSFEACEVAPDSDNGSST